MVNTEKKGVIIQGSARSDGYTNHFVRKLAPLTQYDIIDLLDHRIEHFDYEFKNKGDGFHPLIKTIVYRYDTLVFASPVYWYSMSGHLKVFLDRISDLLMRDKELGRQFRDKRMAVLSLSDDDDIPDSFYSAFRLSANYLGMKYSGQIHCHYKGKDSASINLELATFSKLLLQY